MPDTVSLETQTPPAATTTTPPPEPEGAVEVPGRGRMAPVSAVIEERRARQEARAEADRLRQENESLKKKAESWDVVEPYVPLLATHPKVTGRAAPPAPTNQPDPELLEVAKAFNFYDDAGQPDLERAKSAQALIDKRSGKVTDEKVAPVATSAAAAQAAALRERAYEVVDKEGRPFASREHIDAVLNQLSPEQAAQPQIVNVALMVARGMGGPPAGEPLHTEGPGGPGGKGKVLSSIERAAARARGLSDDQWIKSRDNDSDVLE
jgi:hypothetical protein